MHLLNDRGNSLGWARPARQPEEASQAVVDFCEMFILKKKMKNIKIILL